jgi:hypothetical protein
VDRRDEAASAIGAVNTVWLEGRVLFGGNSDAHGFITDLDDCAPGWDVTDGRAVVLGAGGAARAAVFALARRGLDVAIVNRTVRRAEGCRHYGGRVHGFGMKPCRIPARGGRLVSCPRSACPPPRRSRSTSPRSSEAQWSATWSTCRWKRHCWRRRGPEGTGPWMALGCSCSRPASASGSGSAPSRL